MAARQCVSTQAGERLLSSCWASCARDLWRGACGRRASTHIPGVTWVRPANMLSELFHHQLRVTPAAGHRRREHRATCCADSSTNAAVVGSSRSRPSPPASSSTGRHRSEPQGARAARIEGLISRLIRPGSADRLWALPLDGLRVGRRASGRVPDDRHHLHLNEDPKRSPSGFVQYALSRASVRMGLWWGRDLDKATCRKSLAQLRS